MNVWMANSDPQAMNCCSVFSFPFLQAVINSISNSDDQFDLSSHRCVTFFALIVYNISVHQIKTYFVFSLVIRGFSIPFFFEYF